MWVDARQTGHSYTKLTKAPIVETVGQGKKKKVLKG